MVVIQVLDEACKCVVDIVDARLVLTLELLFFY